MQWLTESTLKQVQEIKQMKQFFETMTRVYSARFQIVQSENELQFAIATLYPRDNLPIATSGSAKRRTGTIKIKVNNVQIHTVRIEQSFLNTKLPN